jgi:hypothetical protein
MMKTKTITLLSFEDRFGSDFDITCTVGRCDNGVLLAYTLRGDLSRAAIPRRAEAAMRKDRLWEDTCLECFIAEGASDGYLEFNLSPAGHWNVYRFDAYRMGMREEPCFSALPIEIHVQARIMRLSCRIDLSAVGMNRRIVHMAPCAVIRSSDGQKSYWAPVHPGSAPDFHRRDAFILQIEA